MSNYWLNFEEIITKEFEILEIPAKKFNGNNFFEIAKFVGSGEEILCNLDVYNTDSPYLKAVDVFYCKTNCSVWQIGEFKSAVAGDWIVKIMGEFCIYSKEDIVKDILLKKDKNG